MNKLLIANYWKEKLKHRKTYEFESNFTAVECEIPLKTKDLQYLDRLTSGNDVATFTAFISIFNVLIQRYFEKPDLILSKSKYINEGVRLLYNVTEINESITFKDLLQIIKAEVQQVYQKSNYEETPGVAGQKGYSFESYTPFGLLFNIEGEKSQKQPFVLKIQSQANGDFTISAQFSSLFVKEGVVQHFLANFKKWVKHLESYLHQPISKVSLLSLQEENLILKDFNNTALVSPLGDVATLADVFEKQASITPDKVAVVFECAEFTYQQINERANQLAFYLQGNYAVKANDFVGIKLKRSDRLIITILAVLKLGAVYVPIDLDYPEARMAYIEKDSDSKVVIDQNLLNDFDALCDRLEKENPKRYNTEEDLAYLIYTSGTTGSPKGVMITHSNAIALLQWAHREFDPACFDIVYAVTSHCFDLSVFEMFYTLSIGASMRVLASALDIEKHLPADDRVLLNTVPSVIRKLMANTSAFDFNHISVLNLAGEPFPADIAQKLVATIPEVRNLYGPSEDTTYSTVYRVLDQPYANVPVGKPISNTRAYILDENLTLLPIGVTGKLYLSGAGVAKGYLNKPELTREKFVTNPYEDGNTMYDTGDLAHWLPDGNIRFLGRKDSQVKLRGYRIELGEIEVAISQFSPDIKQVAADIKNVGEGQVLIAYYVHKNPINKQELYAHLKTKLPAYMVPNLCVELDQIPLTPNGKVDRKALTEMNSTGLIKNEYVAPKNEVEQALLVIWQEVLATKEIGVTDNFFELGGSSLMITQLNNKVHKAMGKHIPFKVFYTNPTIESISKELQKHLFTPIRKAEKADAYPVTPSQQRLWLLSQLKESSNAYQIPSALMLEGEIDINHFTKAFNYSVERHGILRSYFDINEQGVIYQSMVPRQSFAFSLETEDFSTLPSPEEAVDAFIGEQLSKGYDLKQAPLFKAALLKVAETRYVFFLSMHHIISDGWSLEVLTSEIMEAYQLLQIGQVLAWPELPIQFQDYATWLSEEQNMEEQKQAEAYWMNVFQGELPVLELPAYQNRPLVKTNAGKELYHVYSPEILLRLKQFARQQQVTLFTVIMAGVNVLLSKYSNQQDIIIGTPVAGREHPDLENQVGLYLNTLAIRTKLKPEDTYSDVLQREKQQLLEAYSHQKFPFDQLIDGLNLKVDTSRSPLFDVLVAFQNQKQLAGFQNREPWAGIAVSDYPINRTTAQLDLSFVFIENDGLSLYLSYNTDIYEESFVKRMCDHLGLLFEQILAHPEAPVSELNLLTVAEKQQIFHDFNDTAVVYPADKPLVDLFVEQVEKTPDATAVVHEERALTYQELDSLSNQLANYLLSTYKIGAEDLVAVQLYRSEWLMVSLLAVLKAGAAYVPIDPTYPQKRIAYIVSDSNCKFSVDEILLDAFREASGISSERPNLQPIPDKLAYVMYTSGSTGKPKGVMIEEKSIIRLVKSANYYTFTPSDILLSTGAVSFDATTFEFWGTLLNGGKLVMCPQETLLESAQFSQQVKNNGVNVMWLTAGWFNQLVDTRISLFETLRTVIVGGDKLSPGHIRKLKSAYPSLEIINGYGPTENTTFSLTYNIQTVGGNIPIGRPISNSTAYLLDSHLQLLPVGVAGDIWLGGDGLARGYLGAPELTAEKFIHHPKLGGMRLYKTGDLGRWLPDGNMEFIGRKDDQVKIRGHRIEPGEIEGVLLSQPEVKQALVMVKKYNSEPVIVAYIVPHGGLDKEVLKASLSMELPGYMLPHYYILLEVMPLNPNGKVDKKALPEITADDASTKIYIAPANSMEEQLIAIWQEVLQVDKIGATDNFFELGGHSLKMTLVTNKVKQAMGRTLSIKDMFLYPTVRGIASRLKTNSHHAIPQAPLLEDYPVTPSQRRIWILSQSAEGKVAYNIPSAFELEGVLDIEKFTQALYRVVDRHESLRTAFRVNESAELRQHIYDAKVVDISIDQYDLTYVKGNEGEINAILDKAYGHQFDLGQCPLFKLTLIKLSSSRYILVFNMHHIISDGWSVEILVKELLMIMKARMDEDSGGMPVLPLQYKDYAVWLTSPAQQEKLAISEAYWLEQFAAPLPVLELPSYQARPKMKTYHGSAVPYNFSEAISQSINAFASQQGLSKFMLLMAGVNGVLSRYADTGDTIIGTPVAGRNQPGLEGQVGLYLNTLAIRTQFDKTISFEELLAIQKKTLLEAFEHQHYPFDLLVDRLGQKYDTSRSALFDVMVILQNQAELFGPEELAWEGLSMQPYEGYYRQVSQFDMSFVFTEQAGNLHLHLEYNTDLYHADFVKRIVKHLETFLQEAIQAPAQSIATVDFLGEEEKQRLLYTLNDTKAYFPAGQTLVDMFVTQVERAPDAVAVIYEAKSLTYGELDKLSSQLAHYLLVQYQVGSGDLVGVKMDRNEWLVIALMAVLKSGAAYVPIDPNYPEERIAFITTDSNCKVTITSAMLKDFSYKDLPDSAPVACLDEDSLAYVIYTSGSTGKPKGVMITHKSAVTLMHWSHEEFMDLGFDMMYAVTSQCFDLSVFEIFYPLSIGRKVRVLENGLAIPAYLAEDRNILINTVPSVVNELHSNGISWDNVVGINMAGEPIPVALSNQLPRNKIAIRNLYGPSEDTTYSSCYHIKATHSQALPIGKPISNTQFYILSEQSALQPEGVPGELCISGSGLAKGYLNRDHLTDGKFIDNPFIPGQKMYKTGDLVKWLPDGNVAFLGRMDDQVKVRGYRIELSEIENVLQSLAGIEQCVVMLQQVEGENVIVAYYASKEVWEKQKLRLSLSQQLPDYMLPSYYVGMGSIPLTPNGKVDKNALPKVGLENRIVNEYVAPATLVESVLAGIWQKVLHIEQVGVTDNFFDLGGHSLKAMELLSLVHKEFDVSLDLKELLLAPTIQHLAASIENVKWVQEGEVDQKVKKIII